MEEIIGILVALGVLLFKFAKKINDAEDPKIKPVRLLSRLKLKLSPRSKLKSSRIYLQF